jgi:hypothetical protein
MANFLSEDAVLYYNNTADHGGAGTYATPVWVEICNVKDLNANMSKNETDVTTRCSNGWSEFIEGLKDLTIEFGMLYDPSDAGFTAIKNSAFDNTKSVEIFVSDGDISVSGSYYGFRAECMVSQFSRGETLGEHLMMDVNLRPKKNGDSPPQWWTETTP